MGQTSIQWTNATWNPVVGCSRTSPGCERCYAEVMAARIEKMGQTSRYRGLTVVGKHGPRWSGVVRPAPEALGKPLRWRKPRLVFVNSMSDLFHEDLPFEYIAAVFGVMAAAPHHTFQILTKRADRMAEFFRDTPNIQQAACEALDAIGFERGCGSAFEAEPWPLPNVHLGVSVEDQRRADERIPLLLQCPAAVRWVSAEPLLEPLDLFGIEDGHYGPGLVVEGGTITTDYGTGIEHDVNAYPGLDWVVVGGESGRDPRPFDLAWARLIVAQCKAAGVPAFVKQMGARSFDSAEGQRCDGEPNEWAWLKLRDRKGGDPAEWPEDLRVREWPEGRR